MADRTLTKAQRNDLFRQAQEIGLNTSEFKWVQGNSSNISDSQVSALIHEPTEFYFVFYVYNYGRHSQRKPGLDQLEEEEYLNDYSEQFTYAVEWMQCLKKELDEPDLWELAIQQKELFISTGDSGDQDNTPFSPQEQMHLSARLKEIEKGVISLISAHTSSSEMVQQQLGFIKERFDYLEGALSRIGRLDWKALALNTVIAIIIAVSVTPDLRQAVWQFLIGAFQEIFQKPVSLP